MEAKRNYSSEQLANLREISDGFWAETEEKEGKILNKEFFFQVFLALILSIPSMDFFDIQEKYSEKPEMGYKKTKNDPNRSENSPISDEEKPESPENELKNLFYALTKVSDKGTKSKLLLKRTEAKSRYYEECYKYRVILQNYDYNFCGLGTNTSNFLQGREITKIQMEQIKKFGIGPKTCEGCGTKWLQEDKNECLKCDNENSINFYISMACFFQVIGDSERFWLFLDEKTNNIIADNGEIIKEFFRRNKNKITSKKFNEFKRQYGAKQFKELVNVHGVEYVENKPDFLEFNKKYDLALTGGETELNLLEAKNANKIEFTEELSLLHFPFVLKLVFPQRKIDINAFKPDMRNLTRLVAQNCHISQIDLDPDYFLSLYLIDLEENEIKTLYDFIALKKIESLKIIKLAKNPIEETNEIFTAKRVLAQEKKEVQFSVNRMFNFKRDIEDESDSEIQSAIRARGPDDYSELSKSKESK